MNSSELRASIARQIESATGAFGGDVSTDRTELFKRYLGEPYGDEIKDRSGVVSTDISDTVEWIMPELMDVLAGGDKICTFEPEGPEDEEAAEQETDVVNYVFFRQNDGWLALYSFVKDGLIQKNGYLKRYWEEREKVTTEEYSGLDPVEWQAMLVRWLQQGWEVNVLREEMEEDGIGVEVELTRTDSKLVVVPVPPEEVLISSRWTSVNLDMCPFIAHRRAVTVSDLVEMGYSEKQVKTLPDADDDETAEEKVQRFAQRGTSEFDDNEAADDSTREVLVHECYIRADYNGDGKAELRRVMVGGPGYEILKWADGGEDNDEVETQPFSSWTPVVIPHRHYGRSIAELVEDLQRVKTVLFRQMLDNVYLTNNPTREIAEDGVIQGVTLSDMLHERPGKIVRTAAPGHYFEHTPPQFMQQMLPAIQYVDEVRENRTGVTKYNQGLDADSLNKTAHGIERIMSASMRKIALYARICAETGLRHLFRGIHGDLRRNAGRAMTVRLRNQYVQVDPRSWADRADMTVNIGIGTTDKALRMAFLEKIIIEIKEHLMVGSPLVKPSHLFNAYERYISNAGFKNPEEFFINPTGNPELDQIPQKQPQMDPAIMVAAQTEQAKIQQREMEAQRRHQIEQGELQIRALEAQIKAKDQQSDATTDAQRTQIERLKLELEAAKAGLEQQRFAFEQQKDSADRKAAVDTEYLKAGVPPGYTYDADREAMGEAVKAVADMMAQTIAQQQASMTQQHEALMAAVQAMTLPKELVRDSQGRAIGVKTKMQRG